MSDTAQPDFDSIGTGEGADAAEAKPRKMRRLAIAGGIGALLLSAAGYGGAVFFGLFSDQATVATAPPVYFDLPEMTVNLSSIDQRPQYLRAKISLEMSDERTRAAVEQVLPRVLDAFQVYLRELRSTDLEGSAGIYRLKEELVRRVNLAIHPAEINAVVFKEIIVQ